MHGGFQTAQGGCHRIVSQLSELMSGLRSFRRSREPCAKELMDNPGNQV